MTWDDLLQYVRASHVPIYFIGIGLGISDFSGSAKMKSLAAETGGNCELTKAGEVVIINNVTILGPVNLRLKALDAFPGTVLLVTHDRRMLESVHSTRRWVVEGGRLHEE